MVTTYCYDNADRLVTTSEPGVGTVTYDGHGNTTSIWGEQRTYDATDRHRSTAKGATTVSYDRDATDRIISRTSPSGVERYGFTGDTDSPDLTLDATGAVVERTIGLVGGGLLTMRAGTQVWSLPNLHGDVAVVTDAAGVVAGPARTHDPFGNTTGQPLVDNSAGLADYAWLGQHQRLTEHETGLAQTIEMGARQYDPVLGRFLEVDPVEGGSANDYDYVFGNPVDNFDLSGEFCGFGCIKRRAKNGIRKGGRMVDRYVKKRFRRPYRIARTAYRVAEKLDFPVGIGVAGCRLSKRCRKFARSTWDSARKSVRNFRPKPPSCYCKSDRRGRGRRF